MGWLREQIAPSAHHGETDASGAWRPENDALVKATESYERSLDRLAMTVPAYMRAGLDAAKTLDLASIMSEEDPERQRAMAAEAGVAHLFEGRGGGRASDRPSTLGRKPGT